MFQKPTILVVDDEEMVRTVMKEILSEAFDVHTFSSGEACLAAAAAIQPDMVLLDLLMPGMDGCETCSRLRAMPELAGTKIILVSARRRVEDRLRGYEAGADDYITKPFNREELLAKVQVYMRLKRLEEVDRLKSDFLALSSHQTRTPLSEIILSLQMLLNHEDMDPALQREMITSALEGAKRLQRFLQRILDYNALKAGKWTYRFSEEDLGALAEAACAEIASFAEEREVTVVPAVDGPAPCTADGLCIKNVIRDLLHNAVRFSPRGGTVKLRVFSEKEEVTMEITDQGSGIDAAYLPRVFEPFACEDVDHHGDGHNISLTTARCVVRDHGGRIEVESRKGEGTCVRVHLPAAAGAPVTAAGAHGG